MKRRPVVPVEQADTRLFVLHEQAEIALAAAHQQFVVALQARDEATVALRDAHRALVARHALKPGDSIDAHGVIHRSGGK